ncbi:hypothetical protein SD81_018115 [Tolypothrix campylonemoides VB511288]|nr:hypothetical protein SD81_018115 [Tolypothrix campylonemoides VB511288]
MFGAFTNSLRSKSSGSWGSRGSRVISPSLTPSLPHSLPPSLPPSLTPSLPHSTFLATRLLRTLSCL